MQYLRSLVAISIDVNRKIIVLQESRRHISVSKKIHILGGQIRFHDLLKLLG